MKEGLIAQNITKIWGKKEISISFELAKGESLALLGASGSGKSTILRMISGLLNVDKGQLWLNGIDITKVPAGKRGIGMVFQDYALFPHLRVKDNIAYGLRCRGIDNKEVNKEVTKLLTLFQLEHIASSFPYHISGGERQRVALARTIAVGDEVILFDEPLSALDAPLRRKLQEELREKQQELKFAAIYVTHDETEAETLADKTIVLLTN